MFHSLLNHRQYTQISRIQNSFKVYTSNGSTNATIICKSLPPSWKSYNFSKVFKTFIFITYNIPNYSEIWSSLIERFRSYMHWMVSNSIVRHYWPPSWKSYFFIQNFQGIQIHTQPQGIHKELVKFDCTVHKLCSSVPIHTHIFAKMTSLTFLTLETTLKLKFRGGIHPHLIIHHMNDRFNLDACY